MFFRTAAIILTAYLSQLARGDDDDDLSKPGVKFFIQNYITGYVFHNSPGNAIVGMPINGAQPDPQLWTLQFVSQGGEEDSGTVYTLNGTGTNVHLFTAGLPGSFLASKSNASQFLISAIDDNDGLYTIGSPTDALAVTADPISGKQLCLQPINSVSPFQQWAFVPLGPVPEDDD